MSSTHTLAYAQNTKEKGGGGETERFHMAICSHFGIKKKDDYNRTT